MIDVQGEAEKRAMKKRANNNNPSYGKCTQPLIEWGVSFDKS